MHRKCKWKFAKDVCDSQVKQSAMPEPPPVPQYWVYSNLVLSMSGKSYATFRKDIFEKFHNLGLECTCRNPFVWSLEGCFGIHYVMAECHIFKHESEYMIDVQRLSGDRATWYRHVRVPLVELWNNGKYRPIPKQKTLKHTQNASYILLRQFPLEGLACMGEDAKPNTILPLLKSNQPNVVRCAMRAIAMCTSPPTDWSSINVWLVKTPKTLLDRETIRWAHKVHEKKNRNV